MVADSVYISERKREKLGGNLTDTQRDAIAEASFRGDHMAQAKEVQDKDIDQDSAPFNVSEPLTMAQRKQVLEQEQTHYTSQSGYTGIPAQAGPPVDLSL